MFYLGKAMLILSRKQDDKVIINHAGETLTVVVTGFCLDGKRVRLGFDGPKSFTIIRDDIKTDMEGNAVFVNEITDNNRLLNCPVCLDRTGVINANCKNCGGYGKIPY